MGNQCFDNGDKWENDATKEISKVAPPLVAFAPYPSGLLPFTIESIAQTSQQPW